MADRTIDVPMTEDDIRMTMSGKKPGALFLNRLNDAATLLHEEPKKHPTDYSLAELSPVTVSLAVLDVITTEQRNRLATLIDSYQGDTALVWRDGFGEGKNLGFAVYKGREQTSTSLIVNGMIEPDGRTHT